MFWNRTKDKDDRGSSSSSKYLNDVTGMAAQNKLFTIAVIVCALASVANLFIAHKSASQARTVVQPAWSDTDSIWVSNQEASADYLSMMGIYVVRTWADITPGNAEAQMGRLLQLVHPSIYRQKREEWMERAQSFGSFALTSFFLTLSNNADVVLKNDRQIVIRATLNRLVSRSIESRETVEYTVNYKIDNGRFWLIDVTEQRYR